MTRGADCATVGGDQAHWLRILAKTKQKDSRDLDKSKEECCIDHLLAPVTGLGAAQRHFSPKKIAIGLYPVVEKELARSGVPSG